MTLKNSFLANLIENNKRRVWVWVLSLLAYVLVFPAYTAMKISRVFIAMDIYIQDYGEANAQIMFREQLLKSMHDTVGFCDLIVAITAIVAIFSAMQGFSYLFNRKKIDFYHGLPVKRKKRFLIIWLNGIFIFLIPYLTGLVISIGIAASNDALDASVLTEAVIAFSMTILYYLGVYHLAILAVMLTGNVVIAGLGFMVFCVYELFARQAITSFQSMFFHYYPDYMYNEATDPFLSPFQMYMNAFYQYGDEGRISAAYIIELILFALIIGIISYFCYKRRPAEAAGRAMAFPATRAFFKIPIVVLTTLLTGMVVFNSMGIEPKDSMAGMENVIFAMTVAVVLTCGVMQVIYEADIRGALHKKWHIILCGALTALVFLNFRYDLLRYDEYIPNPSKVESVAFIPENLDLPAVGGNTYFDDSGNYISEYVYGKKHMYIKDTSSVCKLARISMEKYEEAGMPVEDNNRLTQWSRASFVYRLKDGREVNRSIMINTKDEETCMLLDKIIGSSEFKKGCFAGASDSLEKLLRDNGDYTIKATYGNTVYDKKVSGADIEGLVAAYRKDIKKVNFSMLQDNIPTAVVVLSFERENGDRGSYVRECSFNIYSFYENCITYVKEHGYYVDYQLNPDDIDRIQVVNSNWDIYYQMLNGQQDDANIVGPSADELYAARDKAVMKDFGEDINTRTFVNYTEADDIAKIAGCVYPVNMAFNDWDHGLTSDEDFDVIVYFKADSEMSMEYGIDAYYSFVEGQVPTFVENDTAYTEVEAETEEK